MTRTVESQNVRRGLQNAVVATVAALTLATANTAHAQQALGVPFVGKNHLSASVTELSRDGIGSERAAVFGGMYGRRINSDGILQVSVLARAAARALDASDSGILDAGLTVAATHAVRAIEGLSITGAAGLAAVVWGKAGPDSDEVDRGRILNSIPLSVGMAYDVRIGAATFSPFVATTTAYSREREYLNDKAISTARDWRTGQSAGVSVRFRETVLSLSSVNRVGGLRNRNRVAFSAGMSW